MSELSCDHHEFTCVHDGERLSTVSAGPPGRATVVLLHGAGTGSKERLLPLLAEFTAHGCRTLAFDFSGHGESTGKLAELSLRRRFEQAVAVIDGHAPADGPLILAGFSMSGQTIADLVGHYGRRVAAVGLCAPAVYAPEAWDVPFGEGDGRFSEIIRTPDGWRDAPALAVLRSYEGRAVLAVPGTDTVIPPEVTEAVQDALSARAQFTRFDVPGAGHRLGEWFREHGDDRREWVAALLSGLAEGAWAATRSWVEGQLPAGRTVTGSGALRGGWSSQIRGLTLDDGEELVLRTFVKPFFRRHAEGLLSREASVLRLLAEREGVPAPALVAVDAAADHCDHPSLLMTRLPGRVWVEEEDPETLDLRLDLLAAQLVRIHAVTPGPERPRTYQAWTSPERVHTPGGVRWERAVEVIRREPPPYRGGFLHRDYHPGNVLFTGAGDGLRISGVVDWVETSWGPADLDVAHCSTALALLHGPEHGLAFRDRYEERGGRGLADGPDHLYWRLLDALTYCPDAGKLAGPWRELGRTDLTPRVLAGRLEAYVDGLLERYDTV
ncbi:phosphotransferase [Streptomyces sp. NBC_00820]|uniref:alpha/beta fold hydrolase n=1 Tax=Streptomyces sp. NBC_00820 TaxID=2975842 RepID=UPI002ED3F544|nr:phosphotransferase [Streptomyces sp. NBC_00820]